MGAATASKDEKSTQTPPSDKPRAYVKQSDVPKHTLQEALRVAQAINDQYAKQPTTPFDVAVAMELTPNARAFEDLTGASVAYGLTEGGRKSQWIALTGLGRRIVAPTVEGDDLAAKREAVLRPRIIRDFLTKYNGSPLPKDTIARNVLEELGVAPAATDRVLKLILDNASELGLITSIKDRPYVRLDGLAAPREELTNEGAQDAERTLKDFNVDHPDQGVTGNGQTPGDGAPPQDLTKNKRVFITHGRNQEVVAQLKELLTFGGFEPVVSVDHETVAKPVPDKVMDDMRSCGAAIIHVGGEQKLLDENGNEHRVINPNVLIEIGAAMALYGRRFILLVERGVTLPSNLQGLYEARYEGSRLDYDATMKLLKAFNDFRS